MALIFGIRAERRFFLQNGYHGSKNRSPAAVLSSPYYNYSMFLKPGKSFGLFVFGFPLPEQIQRSVKEDGNRRVFFCIAGFWHCDFCVVIVVVIGECARKATPDCQYQFSLRRNSSQRSLALVGEVWP